MKKTALVTGIRGQDGAYLAKFLLDKGYRVIGADRRSSDYINWRLRELCINDQIEFHYMDLLELTNIINVLKKTKPDEIYNLGAQSFVTTSFSQPILTAEVDAIGPLRLLEAMRMECPEARFYQASTSEMYGKVVETPQTEKSPFYPRSTYGVAKLFAHWATVNYRESYNMFCTSGILFNHESPLRGLEFVSRKITSTVAGIKHGLCDRLVLGNLKAKRDWGYAKDYVEGMWKMLQHDEAEDFVLATGKTYMVETFVEKSFAVAGINLEWRGEGVQQKGYDKKTGRCLVEVSESFFRPAEVDLLLGDATKAKEKLGWRPEVDFDGLVEMMTEADMRRVHSDIKI